MQKSISVIVNARLESTRLHRKLLRPFAGTTLIDIALEKMNRMDFFENRYLAVAENELAERADQYPNVTLLRRSPEAVKPGFGKPEVIYEHYKRVSSDYIFWLNPCHALLTIETVVRSLKIFQETDYNSYTSVVQTTEWLFDEQGEPVTNRNSDMYSTHHSNRFFKAAHSFHIFNKAFFNKTGKLWTMMRNDPHLIEIPEKENFDSDTPVQFETAQAVYLSRKER